MANIRRNALTKDNTDTRKSMESGVKNASGKPIDEQQRMMSSSRNDQFIRNKPKEDRIPHKDMDDCC